MQFTTPPIHVLTDEQTLALAADPQAIAAFYALPGMEKWRVKSPMLCAFMDELEKEGFVYNVAAQRAFEKAYNLPPSNADGEPGNGVLHTLVYNCQGYRRHDKLVRDGWTPGSPEMLQEAFDSGMGIKVCGSNILGSTVEEIFNVRDIGGKLYAMRPHKKKYAMRIDGLPCKLAPLPKKTARARTLQPA